ncbi:MAG TPA: GAF domain-containing protein, partial [Roseiflexaceae bacterium]|nr:GAF domain-containing protein [Roseiflexaceae bacterium]
MSIVLARWLGDHRDELLKRWEAFHELSLSTTGHTTSTQSFAHGPAPAPSGANSVAVAPDEDQIILGSLYDGLIDAANGDYDRLDETIRLLRALRASRDESELASNTVLSFQLRRAFWDLLSEHAASNLSVQAMLQLSSEFDELIEYVVVALVGRWVNAAKSVERELNETKLLVESLYREAAQTDQTTLHVSRLNELSQSLASNFDETQQLALVGGLLMRTLPLERLTIWQLADDQQHLSVTRHWERQSQPDADGKLPPWRVALDGDDFVARAWKANTLLSTEEMPIEAAGAWYSAPNQVIAMPLVAQGRTLGVLVLQDSSDAVLFEKTEQDFVRSVASQAAIAIANARLYEEVRSFNHVLEQRIAERTSELQFERDTLSTLNEI